MDRCIFLEKIYLNEPKVKDEKIKCCFSWCWSRATTLTSFIDLKDEELVSIQALVDPFKENLDNTKIKSYVSIIEKRSKSISLNLMK